MENNKQMKNELNMKKKVLQITIIVFSLLLLIISLITIASTVRASSNLAFGNYRFYIMKAISQPDIAKKGDLVIAKKTEPGKIQAGDKIVYKDNEFYYCDNVKETKKVNVVNKLIIAEKDGVSYQFDEKDIQGKIVSTIGLLGAIITFLVTPLGIVFFVLFIVCVFALLNVLVSKRKQDNE